MEPPESTYEKEKQLSDTDKWTLSTAYAIALYLETILSFVILRIEASQKACIAAGLPRGLINMWPRVRNRRSRFIPWVFGLPSQARTWRHRPSRLVRGAFSSDTHQRRDSISDKWYARRLRESLRISYRQSQNLQSSQRSKKAERTRNLRSSVSSASYVIAYYEINVPSLFASHVTLACH